MILPALRESPRTTISNNSIYVDCKGLTNGAPIHIREEYMRGYSYFHIQPMNNCNSYFFPYISRGVGKIRNIIPKDGTVVVTPGMNGCALEVCYSNRGYNFYHDADGRYIHTVQNRGFRVCRIEANSYWSDNFIPPGNLMASKSPMIQFICVYKNGFWHVGAFGIYFKYSGSNRINDTISGTFEPVGGKYRGYFNDTIRLLQY